jgi:predicted nucleic acid-binding protein
LIDSSVLISIERSGLMADALTDLLAEEDVLIASITASELLVGVHKADTPARRDKRQQFVEGLIDSVPLIPFDLAVARVHAALTAQLQESGVAIGAHDLIVAATALAHGCDVMTANVREFQRVPGLEVIAPDW